MFVDYVELVPITMEEYKSAKGDTDVLMKDNQDNKGPAIKVEKFKFNFIW